ncbi:probable E3 ubiquitin-protein ligase RHB1A isoform X2 [Salvia miltiorrhiza]|uniref:probable E3 ubiquitin-protein ligase RHB1A isoform X2 n=1 Tax=Salvia miltiorrhiza TaxID=226208 RepID=UPI0025AB8A1B|nr:probable E3 ubiquitin-protein ligase RHB1A isoform X2 [Salvia miltiorrhiza]XP_057776079.1 probable E3 ubiquitin-protein ligase RHB1A isoform X2 [Salvia miltiorrhiza]XP_057776081.1 probable E3 ubiquitin-protein ligase RHB1A isoform X2 [Salvia miltiorrhiza]XP_057776082.1 probable E3 ubiquitin-protein ligase RHB1A isoform X2 [Salvia miltiorrhiza]XP_057776083.1 probable E3 ubiquitin-protein ligase RHB1A isoform X2 [Salvia miltiorrhiza]XP_057776084.1 probable E3 ubiquitin-protein ligase RHB1A is
MGGCCCCCASDVTERNRSPPFFHHPVSEEHEPLSSHNEISTFSTGLLVDTNLDTSVPDTYRPPPAPIPYETYIGRPSTPSRNQEGSGHEVEVALGITNVVRVEDINNGNTLETKVKKQPDENEEKDIDLEASKLMEDESSDELKKSSKLLDPPIIDEDDCPICLEEYVEENPKILTKCDHHFHLACILEWMERSDICPVCDQEMVISPAAGV